MAGIWYGILLSLILGLLTIQANPKATKGNDNNTTTKPDKADEGSLSKGIIAVIIGIGLTTFFVVVIAYHMIRGYRKQNSADMNTAQDGATHEKQEDHAEAQSNLGLSSV